MVLRELSGPPRPPHTCGEGVNQQKQFWLFTAVRESCESCVIIRLLLKFTLLITFVVLFGS